MGGAYSATIATIGTIWKKVRNFNFYTKYEGLFSFKLYTIIKIFQREGKKVYFFLTIGIWYVKEKQ
jgi:hypothetical protein